MLNIFQLFRLINQEAGKAANSTCKEFISNALAQQVISPEVWWHEDTGLFPQPRNALQYLSAYMNMSVTFPSLSS